ncbi:MAG TPA: Ig domain-containing protein [Phycisphaerae bacterium]|nr:Ig domain-containing protein [Phycisphaerae bacterium]
MKLRFPHFRVVSLTLAVVALTGVTCETNSLDIDPSILPDGAVDADYEVQLSAEGSTDGIWTISSGDLPDGLALDGSTIAGEPAQSGNFQITVQVDRPFEGAGQRTFSFTIHPKLVVSFSLETARQDEPYEESVGASGGVPPYAFDVVGLPAGLDFDPDTGEISGTPIEAQSGRTVEATVTDSGTPGQSETRTSTLLIKPRAVDITTESLPQGRVNIPYDGEVEAIDGLPPYSFSITDGALPPGLSLPDDQDTGEISGVPSEEGVFTFTVTVTDDDEPQSSDSVEYTITIAPP